MLDANRFVGSQDLLFVTLDTLRYDVARDELAAGRTPTLARILPGGQWEERHSPGSFTYSAHAAFFAGFLPTPVAAGHHERLLALRFPGSETTGGRTCVFDAPDIVTGLRRLGYHTICVGGVGFFNKQSPLGRVFPDLFDESHWRPELGVTDPESMPNQVRACLSAVESVPRSRNVFLFLNVAAIHQPNCFYLPGARSDSLATHAAAHRHVDLHLGDLFVGLRRRGPWLCVICSDHGTAYGEDGYSGHRLAHPVVWTVPYAEFVLEGQS
jgi:hypothetical protein